MTSDREVNLAALTDVNTPWAIRAAVTLEIPDAIGDEPITCDEIAKLLAVDSAALGRLLRYLACRGVFTEPEPDVFAHNDVSRQLCAGHSSQWDKWLRLGGIAARLDRAATEGLVQSVRSGGPSYDTVFGTPMWTDIAENPEYAEEFDALMRSQNHRWISGVLEHDFSQVARVIDVGGGTGGLLTELLQRWTSLRGTLVDMETNVSAARQYFDAHGIADRADAVAGDFFGVLPEGDVYLLAHVLHDWNDQQAEAILRSCVEAAPRGARVLIAERAIDVADNCKETSIKDLRMLTLFGGRERDVESFRRIASNAGLTESAVQPIQAGHYLLEFVKQPW